MKFFLFLFRLGAALAVLAFILSFPVRANFASRATLAQRIEKSDSDSLFGTAGTPLGEPMLYIVDDPKAFLSETAEGGARLLDENYLNKNKIYPLQLQSVDFMAHWVRVGSGVAFLILGLGSLWLGRRVKAKASAS